MPNRRNFKTPPALSKAGQVFNKRLKIAFLIDDSLDRVDGVQQYVLCLGAYLSRLGHRVYYLTNKSQRTDLANLYSFGRLIRVNFNGNRLGTPFIISGREIKGFVSDQHFDILHVQSPHSPLFGARFINYLPPETKVVSSLHVMPYGKLAKLGLRGLGFLMRRNLAKVDTFIANTPTTAQFFQTAWSIKPQFIALPIRLVDFKTSQRLVHRPAKINLVFLGRLVPRKGVLQLIEAVSLLDERLRAKIHLHIGGRGQLAGQLKRQLQDRGLEANVSLHGYIAEADKAAFLASGDLAIFPSLGGESFGIVLLEAMVSGRSVVLAGKNSGYNYVLGHEPQLMFDARQPASIAACLTYWLKTSNLKRQQMRRALSKYVRQYDVDTVIGPQTLELYKAVLETP